MSFPISTKQSRQPLGDWSALCSTSHRSGANQARKIGVSCTPQSYPKPSGFLPKSQSSFCPVSITRSEPFIGFTNSYTQCLSIPAHTPSPISASTAAAGTSSAAFMAKSAPRPPQMGARTSSKAIRKCCAQSAGHRNRSEREVETKAMKLK